MPGVAPRPRSRYSDATADSGTWSVLAGRRAIVAVSRSIPQRLNGWSDPGTMVRAAAAGPCPCPVPEVEPIPPEPIVCPDPDFTGLAGSGFWLTQYLINYNAFALGNLLDPSGDLLNPFRVCNYGAYFTFPTVAVLAPAGVLVAGSVEFPIRIRRYCFTVVPAAGTPMDNIRFKFAADDGVALRIQDPSSTVLCMRWSMAAGPSQGGTNTYSIPFSIGCDKTTFELVTANALPPNNFYELGIYWIQSPGPSATQAQLDLQPTLPLAPLCWRPAVQCPPLC